MLGRNIDEEYGNPGRASPVNSMSSHDNELMGEATRCVRKFAPEGRKKMRRTDNGHITACKISDENPNEMIASWSGDHIYSFDLVRSPDARENEASNSSAFASGRGKGKVKESGDRKRKRKQAASATSPEGSSRSPRPRRAKERAAEDGELALRVRYENGQSEDIVMGDAVPSLPPSLVEEARESMLNESQKRSMQIAKSIVRIRKMLFSLEASSRAGKSLDPFDYQSSFTSALGLAATSLPEMAEISRSWRYPVNPLEEDIQLQRTLRANRDSSCRFVQAAGTLSRMLGGKIQTTSRVESPALAAFREIALGPHEGLLIPMREQFCYDFLKAIILWLDGGPQALLQGFKQSPNQRKDKSRFPIPDEAQLSGLDEHLIPYLLGMAREVPIYNIDTSRFERDETREFFRSESAAVLAFANAIKMPLDDLSKAVMPASGSDGAGPLRPLLQDKNTAVKYWGFRVGRGILMSASQDVNFQFVDMAFGGLGLSESGEGRVQEHIDPDEEDDVIDKVSLVKRSALASAASTEHRSMDDVQTRTELEGLTADRHSPPSTQQANSDIDIDDADSNADVILMDDLHDEIAEHLAAEEANEDDEDIDGHDDEDDGADDEDDGDITAEERQFMFQSASDRGKLRERVEANVPCYPHTRKYTGHCNVKTVKDANFFGLQDEYVVSGSDDGHLFIWDKKTSQCVNILEGDNEVVNVIQGKMPYHKEP